MSTIEKLQHEEPVSGLLVVVIWSAIAVGLALFPILMLFLA